MGDWQQAKLVLTSQHQEGAVRGERGNATTQCWRCGVDFDPSLYIPGAPCADCQFDEPTNEWVRFDDVAEREADRREYHVKRLWARRYSDREIAEALGLGREQVRRTRDKLQLQAHTFTGDEKWRDPEAVKAVVGARMRGKNYKQGWAPGQKHGKEE